MKRFYFSFVALLTLMSFALSGCDDDDILWDIAPLEVEIMVVDTDGNNLLDSNFSENILNENVTLTVNGKSDEYLLEDPTRAILPYYYGAIVMQNVKGENILVLGQWDATNSTEYDIELEICGETHKIRIVNDYKYQHNEPKVKTTCFLDGKSVSKQMMLIINK